MTQPHLAGFRLGVYAFEDAEIIDFAAPYGVLSVARRFDPEIDAFLVADAARPVQTQAGFTVLPNYSFQDSPAMDAFLIPGGFGTRQEMHNRRLHAFIRSLPTMNSSSRRSPGSWNINAPTSSIARISSAQGRRRGFSRDRVMTVAAIWRYPVKSMSGERLSRAQITSTGVMGDRVVQVYDRHGASSPPVRSRACCASGRRSDPTGEPLVDGRPWRSPEVAARVEAAVARGARLQGFDGPERFDILPLLVCTDGAVSILGRDVRRLRPNLLIGGVEGAAERDWQGATLEMGDVTVGLADLRARCVMTTYDPDTIEQDPTVLRDIVRRFGGRLCLNARVVRPGTVEEGEVVHTAGTLRGSASYSAVEVSIRFRSGL